MFAEKGEKGIYWIGNLLFYSEIERRMNNEAYLS